MVYLLTHLMCVYLVNTDLIRVFINKHQACEFWFLREHTSYMCVYVLLLTSVACVDQRWKVKVGSPWGHRGVNEMCSLNSQHSSLSGSVF